MIQYTAGPRVSCAVAVIVLLGMGVPSSPALINPKFTPANLENVSRVVVKVQIQRGKPGALSARIVETLKGQAPDLHAIGHDESAAEALANLGADGIPAILFLSDDLSGAGEVTTVERPVGAVHLRDGWLGVYAAAGGYQLRADSQDLKTVWAGSTEMLEAAMRYAVADPARASFPVSVGVRWRGETKIADKVEGLRGLRAVELAAGAGPVLHAMCDNGDRLFAPQETSFKETTAERTLGARSRHAVWVDLDADGRLDLVSWDGKAVTAWMQGADGRFSARGGVPLATCTGLEILGLGNPARPVVAAAADAGVSLFALKGADLAMSATLTLPEEMRKAVGAPGPLLAADFDGDGRTDLAGLYEQGVVVWAGTAEGSVSEARVAMQGRVGRLLVTADTGDFDGDGRLDILVGGRLGAGDGAGVNLLASRGGLVFVSVWNEAGEVYKTQTRVASCLACDINHDGRTDLFLGYERSGPAFMFNRGFRTFGTADEMTLAGATVGEGDAAKELACGMDLMNGAPFGVVADFDGDGAQDAVCAGKEGQLWAIWRDRGASCFGLLLVAPVGGGPVRGVLPEGKTIRRAFRALPGCPAYSGFANKGAVKVEWIGADGKVRAKTVMVTKPVTRIELTD